MIEPTWEMMRKEWKMINVSTGWKRAQTDQVLQEQATLSIRRATETVIALGKLSAGISCPEQENDSGSAKSA